MAETRQVVRPAQYASSDDFQQIFKEEMNSLYLLSFLLTADRQKAEECFVSGLEDAVEGNPVFKEWARSWAKRKIIENALSVMKATSAEESARSVSALKSEVRLFSEEQLAMASILALPTFERFVYVISVLEHYSDQECCVLLGCSRRDMIDARTRALQALGKGMESNYHRLVNTGSEKTTLGELRNSFVSLFAPHLAITA